MKPEDWNPGHSLNKGYPYAGLESQRQLPNRIKIILAEDNKLELKLQEFGDPGADLKDQLMFSISRAFDFQEALTTAEQQIMDLLHDDPFLPEQFGFDLVHKPESISDSPIRVYSSIHDDRFTMHREIIDVHDSNLDATKWVIMKKHEGSDKFDSILVKIPCTRIAYALFSALGLVMEAKEEMPATGFGEVYNGPIEEVKVINLHSQSIEDDQS